MPKCCDKLVVSEGLMSDSLNNKGQILGWLSNYFKGERKTIWKAWNLQGPRRGASRMQDLRITSSECRQH